MLLRAAATARERWLGSSDASSGREEQATEIPLLVKSTRERYADLEAAIRARHPYNVPEIIAWPIEHGFPGYLAWVEQECAAPGSSS